MNRKIIRGLIYIIMLACALCLASCEDMVNNGINTHTHEFGAWSDDNATCTDAGIQTRSCSGCSAVETRPTVALGHDMISYKDREPTCIEKGCVGYSACSRCNYFEGEQIDALGHDMPNEWIVTTEPECRAEGVKTRFCNVCHAPETDKVKALGHNLSVYPNVEPTCTEGGYFEYKECSRCEYTAGEKLDALGHDCVAFEDKEPTCTEYGYSSYGECSRCEYTEGEKINPNGHSMSEWINNTATCTAGGIEECVCANGCGHGEKRDSAPLGHDINSEGECERCHKRDIVILIEEGVAKFNVVVTSKASGEGMAVADAFIFKLRSLGIEIGNRVTDDDPSSVTDCEIIIGAGAANRGDECCITERQIGTDGTIIKIVGNRIIIAGATPTLTARAFNKFVDEHLGIKSDTKELNYLEADSTCCYEDVVEYAITSLTIAGNDLSEYGYVLDVAGASAYGVPDINKFHDQLFAVSGYWLPYVLASNMTDDGKYFIIRYVDYAGEEGFRSYVDGDNLIVECSYRNMFNTAFVEFADLTFLSKSGTVAIDNGFTYEKTVNVVYYEDFGAVGDGVTCDFEAIYNAHVFANAGGQRVLSRLGAEAIYYISADKFTMTIPVKTNVDFCGATFVVDDLGESAYKYRKLALFTLARDYAEVIYRDEDESVFDEKSETWVSDGIIDKEELRGITISVGESDFSWLSPYLSTTSLVKIENKLHHDFIRHGSNQNSGATRRDVFIVHPDGTVESDTLPVFDFDNISTIEIYRADDKPITIENGNFINIACRTVASTEYVINGADGDESNDILTTYANKFHEYQRGFIVNRTNATIKNVKHTMQDEPELGWYPENSGYAPDSMHDKFGSRHESYPYYGFVYVINSYNFTLSDSELTGHKTYYEDKPATASTGWVIPEPVAMGTYDFVLEYSSNITFSNVSQTAPQDLTDVSYWGIMSSNGTKNLTLTGCRLNRFDAHRGFWNANITDTYIGHSFQVVGGGTLYVENVTKAAKSNFMTFRGDYGATFNGDIILKDCTYEGRKEYYSTRGEVPTGTGAYANSYIFTSGYDIKNSGYSASDSSGGYWLWDFGYTCYMPVNVTIDNFKSLSANTYVFNDLPDIIFEQTYVEGTAPDKFTVRYPYQLTKSITQMNMTKAIPTYRGTTKAPSGYPTYTYSKLNSIPVTKINIGG